MAKKAKKRSKSSPSIVSETTQAPVALGDFPFRLADGPSESLAVTWLRNHSSYLTVGGIGDYLVPVAVLLRGLIVNFLVLVPWIILAGLALGFSHHWILNHDLLLLKIAVGMVVVFMLMHLVAAPLFRIWRYNRSLEVGSIDNATQRIWRERVLGLSLAIVALAALVELSPRLIEHFRLILNGTTTSLTAKLITAAGITAILGSSQAILSKLSGQVRTIAIVLMGVTGLIIPWVAIMCVANYLVYAAPPESWSLGLPTYVAGIGSSVIVLALVVGTISRSFSRKEAFEMVGLAVFVCLVSTACWLTWTRATEEQERSLSELGILSRPLGEFVRRPAFANATKSNAADAMRDIEQIRRKVNEFYNAQPVHRNKSEYLTWYRKLYETGQPFVESGERLAGLSGRQQHLLRTAIAKRDRHELLRLCDEKRVKKILDPIAASEFRDAIIEASARRILSEALSSTTEPGNDDPAHKFYRGALQEEFDSLWKVVDSHPFVAKMKAIRIRASHQAEFESLIKRDGEHIFDDEQSGMGNVASLSSVSLVPDDYSTTRLLELKVRETLRYQCQLHPFKSLRSEDFLAEVSDRLHSEPGDGFDRGEAEEEAAEEDEAAEAEGEAGKPDPSPVVLDADLRTAAAREFLRPLLARKALKDFDVNQLAHLADTTDILYLPIPKHAKPFQPVTQDLEDETTIWFAAKALEGIGADGIERDQATAARNLLAERYAQDDHAAFLSYVYEQLISIALDGWSPAWAPVSALESTTESTLESTPDSVLALEVASRVNEEATFWAREVLGNLYFPSIPSDLPDKKRESLYATQKGQNFRADELVRIAASKFVPPTSPGPDRNPDRLAARVASGEFGYLNGLDQLDERMFSLALLPKLLMLLSWVLVIWLFSWLAADINFNSLHGYYRDRLARAFLLRTNSASEIEVEEDVALADLSNHHARSIAPYHIINVTLNLHGSGDIGLRDRRSDFFAITKRFVGSSRTGYCRSGTLRLVFPQVSLATSMAISAGAASPNMGRISNPFLVMFMSLLNIRLGYWIPNPGLLEEKQNKTRWREKRKDAGPGETYGFSFDQVFQQELGEVQSRWQEAYEDGVVRTVNLKKQFPTVDHGLFGIGLSGGGIRSATLNLGILQTLDRCGMFRHVDFLSTVSGGGYLGASISTQMRARTSVVSKNDGAVTVTKDDDTHTQVVRIQGDESREYRFSKSAQLAVRNKENVGLGKPLIHSREAGVHADFEGTVQVISDSDSNQQIVVLSENIESEPRTFRYRFTEFDHLVVETGDLVAKGQAMVARNSSLSQRFLWAVPPRCLYREMLGLLHAKGSWVNLSDGGHIENLAGMELLRRRCKFIILGDGESDVAHSFNGLATLLRFARIDLGIEIDIGLAALKRQESGSTQQHWAIGKITYPKRAQDLGTETGYLLYLKSSMTGDEGELINEYRNNHHDFPHQATADQFFNEGQFEAYRALGQHIAEQVLADAGRSDQELSFDDMADLMETLYNKPNVE